MITKKINWQRYPWLTEIKAIGWDLDGTLYPADAIPFSMIHRLQIDKVMTKNEWNREKAESEFAKIRQELGSTTQTMNALGVDGEAFFTNLWNELPLEDYLKPDPKLVEMFNKLVGFRHFIVSNSNLVPVIEKKVRLLGLEPTLFEVIISTNEVGVSKPDPRPFEVALVKLDLPATKTLYVGDRVETDIVGAKGAGMRTCLVGSESAGADICLKQVYDLEKMFQ